MFPYDGIRVCKPERHVGEDLIVDDSRTEMLDKQLNLPGNNTTQPAEREEGRTEREDGEKSGTGIDIISLHGTSTS